MKAKTLPEAIRVFDPREPLSGPELAEFYVNRPGNPLNQIEIYLQGMAAHDEPVKLLFTGHTGSGKSTELNKLAEELRNQFFIVPFAAQKLLPIAEISYVDVLLGMASALFRLATDRDVIARAPAQVLVEVWEDISRFFESVIFGKAPFRTPPPGIEFSAKVNFLAGELQAKFISEGSTRSDIRPRVEARLSELIGKVNLLADEIQKEYRRSTLFIVEGTDKLDLSRARDLFFGHSTSLTDLRTSVIYTFPIGLRYSPEFSLIKTNFHEHFLLPNLRLSHRDGTPDPNGLAKMAEVMTRRMDDGLVDEAARDEIIAASGGLIRTLIQLVQRAAVHAVGYGSQIIYTEDVQYAIDKERGDLIAMLARGDYTVLAARHADKQLSSDAAVHSLLQSRALLEYGNGDPWCDVHPIILPVVLERTT